MIPGYVIGQIEAPQAEEQEEPLYVNAKQVTARKEYTSFFNGKKSLAVHFPFSLSHFQESGAKEQGTKERRHRVSPSVVLHPGHAL